MLLGPAASDADPTLQVTISGTLSVLQEDDFERDRSRRIYRLRDSVTGQIHRLDFAVAPDPRLVTGSSVVVRGRLEQDSLTVEGGVEVVEWAAASETGERRVLVLITDFQDATVSCADAYVEEAMFTGTQSVDGLYRESSFGLVSFPGDTDGDGQSDILRLSIDALTTDPCNYNSWADQANQAADEAGIDRSLYQHTLYVLPGNTCQWAGLANVGCSATCRSWIRSCGLKDLYAHELGHNLGMRHASSDLDNDGQIDSVYGDWSDIMGTSGLNWRRFNGPHNEWMGWLPPDQIVEVTTTGTSEHVIAPLGSDPTTAAHPQLLKIFNPGRGDYYYLSYRRRSGYDATLRSEYADKTNVHRFSGSGNTLFVATVDDGQDLVDDTEGLTITQLAHDDGSATIRLHRCGSGSADADGDGTPDCDDVCPYDREDDRDGDGFCADVDNCPTVSNASQANSDGDALGDACDACPNDAVNDADGDGVCGDVDNCPGEANASQADSDGDGLGNPCDACPNDADNDADGDGVCGDIDNCPAHSNASQDDSDGDGTGDACDECADDPDKTSPGSCGCGVSDADYDGDGAPDCLSPPAPPGNPRVD